MAKTIPVRFPNGRGEELAARLEYPEGAPRAFALFAHCFTCSKDVKAASRISRGLRERGLAVLRFDFTGLGSSDGDFANEDFSTNVADLRAAAAFLEAEHEAPALLCGHSLGGAAVLSVATGLDSVRAVATIGAPSSPAHVRGLLADDAARIEREGRAEVELAGRRFTIRREFLDDLEEHDLEARVRGLDAALLVVHAPDDGVVPVEEGRRLFGWAAEPKSFLAVGGGGHMLDDPADAEYVASVVAAWADRYLPGAESTEGAAGAKDGEVLVEELEGLTQRIVAGRHEWRADEPAALGGADAGPTPYDLLLASLGACTSMTLRMYARRKGWPLESIAVRLLHDRIHASDCEDCETKDGRIDRIEKVLALRGELDDGQVERLLEIADRCPVHRTLTNEKRIVTRLA